MLIFCFSTRRVTQVRNILGSRRAPSTKNRAPRALPWQNRITPPLLCSYDGARPQWAVAPFHTGFSGDASPLTSGVTGCRRPWAHIRFPMAPLTLLQAADNACVRELAAR